MKDVFGRAAMKYWQNPESGLSIETISSLGDEDEIPVSYLFRSIKDMPKLERFALRQCSGRVLELGCGVGSHLLELGHLEGFGLDSSPRCIEICRARGIEHVHCSRWQDFKPLQKWDTLLCLMNGLGLAECLKNLPNFLTTTADWLHEGGSLLIDSSDISYLFERDEDGGMWVPATAYYGDLNYQISFEEVTEAFDWLFVSFEELQKVCASLGYRCEKLFEGKNQHYLARITP